MKKIPDVVHLERYVFRTITLFGGGCKRVCGRAVEIYACRLVCGRFAPWLVVFVLPLVSLLVFVPLEIIAYLPYGIPHPRYYFWERGQIDVLCFSAWCLYHLWTLDFTGDRRAVGTDDVSGGWITDFDVSGPVRVYGSNEQVLVDRLLF